MARGPGNGAHEVAASDDRGAEAAVRPVEAAGATAIVATAVEMTSNRFMLPLFLAGRGEAATADVP